MNILMINVPFAGHTNPALPPARAPVERGRRVAISTPKASAGLSRPRARRFCPTAAFLPSARKTKALCFRAAYDAALSLTERFDLLIYEIFFYPGSKIAQLLALPCVRQFSQPARNTHTFAKAGRRLRLSLSMTDRMVMGRKSAARMRVHNPTLAKAVLFDKPALNVVYAPQLFQSGRDTFGGDFLFNPAHARRAGANRLPLSRVVERIEALV